MAPRLHGDQRGAAALEFAIILPLLLTVLFSLWEFGRIFDAWLIATNAAREGARYAIESGASDDTAFRSEVQSKIQAYLNSSYGPRLNGPDADIHINLSSPSYFQLTGTRGTGPITVAVTATVDIYAPIVGALSDSSGRFAVGAISRMRQ